MKLNNITLQTLEKMASDIQSSEEAKARARKALSFLEENGYIENTADLDPESYAPSHYELTPKGKEYIKQQIAKDDARDDGRE